MRWLLLSLAILAGTTAFSHARWTLGRCADDRDSCLETCTLQWGTTEETRGRLLSCRSQCGSVYRSCRLSVELAPHAADGSVQAGPDAGGT